MHEKYTYLLVDFLCIIFPLAFSFYPKIRFHRQWRFFALPCTGTALFFVVWDIIFTRLGVWSFNPEYLFGAYLWGLPLEEYLFFICIPYACVFTYYSLLFFKFSRFQRTAELFSIVLVGFLLVVAATHMSRLYTSVTFLLLSLFLMYLLAKRVRFLPGFYISFFIILVPFFISNGVLTGSFTTAPVVRYNNEYNLGIRLGTIPLEDIFYGMLLVLMNISGYEYFKKGKG